MKTLTLKLAASATHPHKDSSAVESRPCHLGSCRGDLATKALLKGVARREFDMVAAWSVDRLGRSLKNLIEVLSELHAKGVATCISKGWTRPRRAGGLTRCGFVIRFRLKMSHIGGNNLRHHGLAGS